jgi:hypothetical protein
MSGTQKQYQVGEAAARAWLNKNENFYSGMISDDMLMQVVKAIVDAIVITPKPTSNTK